jgi:hypothetical protein
VSSSNIRSRATLPLPSPIKESFIMDVLGGVELFVDERECALTGARQAGVFAGVHVVPDEEYQLGREREEVDW